MAKSGSKAGGAQQVTEVDHEATIASLKNKVREMQEEVIKLREEAIERIEKQNSKAYTDEEYEEFIKGSIIVNGILSEYYKGRIISIRQAENGAIYFYFLNQNMADDKDYKGTSEIFSPESFLMIAQACEFAVKKFGLNKQELLSKLTDKGELNFRSVIANF